MKEAKEVPIPEAHHQLLAKQPVALLTTIRPDGMPSTNPVGYLFDGARIRISTLRERFKCRNIEANPRVAFCVVSFKNPMEYLEVRGRATIEDDADRSFFRKQFRAGAGVDPPDDLDPPEARRVVITIFAENVSSPELYGGRFDVS